MAAPKTEPAIPVESETTPATTEAPADPAPAAYVQLAPPTVVQVAAATAPPLRMHPVVPPRERFRTSGGETVAVVRGSDPAYQYAYILPGDYPDAVALQAQRQTLIDEGWVPRSGPVYLGPATGEFVEGQAAAEVWRRDRTTQNEEFLERLVRTVLSYSWACQYKRHPNNQLPEKVSQAVLVYHGLEKLPPGKRAPPTAEDIANLIWAHCKPHPTPGQRRENRTGW